MTTSPEQAILDAHYMARALELARKGHYTTHPNPRVGCVIVRDGQIVGEGWHVRTGEREVKSLVVGELVMAELQKLDEVAYIRFASVYRRFQDLNEFREEIDRLAREPVKE